MEIREAIYNFILNSNEYEKYNQRKKLISISSCITIFIGFVMIFSSINLGDDGFPFLIAGISLIIVGFLYIFILIPIFLLMLRKSIYKKINDDIIEWIKKIKDDIKIDDEKLKTITISSKMNNYNYKKTNLTLMTDDINLKLKEIIKTL